MGHDGRFTALTLQVSARGRDALGQARRAAVQPERHRLQVSFADAPEGGRGAFTRTGNFRNLKNLAAARATPSALAGRVYSRACEAEQSDGRTTSRTITQIKKFNS
jgi:hypothetical protein